MTSTELITKAPGLLIPQPFAAGNGSSSHGKQFTDIWNTFEGHGSDVNFVDGFTPAFEAPGSQGGRYVKRKEMNAIGHLASANWFKRLCGGVFQFDANMAAIIGGYPKGAVLEYLDGLNYYRVVSLVENNKVDYTGATPTSAQASAGIVAGTVDNVNWAYCERGIVEEGQPHTIEIPVTFPTNINYTSDGETTPCGIFTATASGLLSVYGPATVTRTGTGAFDGGFGVIIKESPFTGGPWSTKYTMVYTAGAFVTAMIGEHSISYSSLDYTMFNLTAGHTYDIQLVGCNCSATLDLKAKIV